MSCSCAPALAAASYQPKSNVTRGIYAPIHRALSGSAWAAWGSGYRYVADRPHGGKACVRCASKTGAAGQGVFQTIELEQTTPKPVKIAGWSRCQGVKGERSYHYSLYVDFTLADGSSWPMQIAAFEPGTHGWQHAETVVTPPKAIRTARFHAFLRGTDGVVWFDDLFFGEAGGTNRLACPGFEEADRTDVSLRDKLFADLKALHCNAVHGYLNSGLTEWEEGPSAGGPVAQFLDHARGRGVGVWLTVGLGGLPIRDARDPNFPQYHCVNGDWGRRWTATLARIARFPLTALSMTPDEYNWNHHRFKRAYAKHRDPKVRAFYENQPTYCDCPVCRKQFEKKYRHKLPVLRGGMLTSADERHRQWLEFRYDSTTAWLKRTCAAVKKANPAIRTDSLICVTPLCSDWWYGPGIAWDRAGYEAGLEYPTTDPYIQLHNYLGDSTHWYVTETAEHLAASSPGRRCGVVLEAARIRREYRELDPVEIYGSALSAVWHGADELTWWHLNNLTGERPATNRPEASRACVAGVHALLERIDPWLDGVTPEPRVAFLFSRASCDWWRIHAQARGAKPPFDTRDITDPRWAAIAQKEILYTLLRMGVPTTVYYLESVRREELARHSVLVVPFALAINDAQAKLLRALARSGKRVVLVSQDGPLRADGTPRDVPALRDVARLPARDKLVAGTTPCGSGVFTLLSPVLLDMLTANRGYEKRSREERIVPPDVPRAACLFLAAAVATSADGTQRGPLLGRRSPEGDDLELCLSLNRKGEKLFLAINWDAKERRVTLPKRPCFDAPPAEAYRLGPDGTWAPWAGTLRPQLTLQPQQALVVRLAHTADK